jgi:tRNA (adenine57-N1/adenine58-N1)-methyltransferase
VARSIGPSGRLWSYEFHEARAKKAKCVFKTAIIYFLLLIHEDREEFAQHGMSDIVTLTHQNVCKDGFNLTDAADSGNARLHFLHAPRCPYANPQSFLIYLLRGMLSTMPNRLCGWVLPLDLREPALTPSLQKDRTTRICCFSPCMEQVLRTVSALNDAGFSGLVRAAIHKPNLTAFIWQILRCTKR